MSGTISLTGPAETPGAPQLTAAALNTAINGALNTKAPLSAPVLVAPVNIGTGGATMTGPLLQATGNANQTEELSVQNLSNGNAASSDLVITADNGDDSTNYVDLGINSSTYNQAAYNVAAAGDGYLYSASSNLAVGTAAASKIIRFHTGGTTTTQIRATITDTGINSAAIGATTPSTGAFTTLSASSTVSGAGISALFSSPAAIGSGTPAAGTFTTLTVNTSISGAGLTAAHASPGPIGSTSASTGAFTTLTASSTVSGAGFTALQASPGPIGSTAANTGAFTTLSASSTVSGTGFSTYLASPPAIGGTTAAAGSFTTLTASSAVAMPSPPAAITATTYTVGANDTFLIFNGAATCTVTLPTVASSVGRILWVKTIAAFTVVSNASNVQPRTSATAGTAILAAAAGNWAFMVCNGTNWIVMAGT